MIHATEIDDRDPNAAHLNGAANSGDMPLLSFDAEKTADLPSPGNPGPDNSPTPNPRWLQRPGTKAATVLSALMSGRELTTRSARELCGYKQISSLISELHRCDVPTRDRKVPEDGKLVTAYSLPEDFIRKYAATWESHLGKQERKRSPCFRRRTASDMVLAYLTDPANAGRSITAEQAARDLGMTREGALYGPISQLRGPRYQCEIDTVFPTETSPLTYRLVRGPGEEPGRRVPGTPGMDATGGGGISAAPDPRGRPGIGTDLADVDDPTPADFPGTSPDDWDVAAAGPPVGPDPRPGAGVRPRFGFVYEEDGPYLRVGTEMFRVDRDAARKLAPHFAMLDGLADWPW